MATSILGLNQFTKGGQTSLLKSYNDDMLKIDNGIAADRARLTAAEQAIADLPAGMGKKLGDLSIIVFQNTYAFGGIILTKQQLVDLGVDFTKRNMFLATMTATKQFDFWATSRVRFAIGGSSSEISTSNNNFGEVNGYIETTQSVITADYAGQLNGVMFNPAGWQTNYAPKNNFFFGLCFGSYSDSGVDSSTCAGVARDNSTFFSYRGTYDYWKPGELYLLG